MYLAIHAVIFDIGGVLLTLGETRYRAEVARLLGLDSLGVEYESCIPAMQRGELSEERVWAQVAGRLVDVRKFDRAWLDNFPPDPAMLALAAEMRALGLRTGVLSNTQDSHVRLMRSMGFLQQFDPVILSCVAGCRKPEPAAFNEVLHLLDLPGEAVAFVDDVPEYVEAAQAVGMHGIWHQGDAGATRGLLHSLLGEQRWQPLGETEVLNGYWQVTDGRFRLPDGKAITRRLIHGRHPAMVLCLNEHQQVLLIRQYRPPFNEVMWEIPGGDMDDGESIVQAAARECEEETGFRPLNVEHVLSSRASPGESDAEFHICIAHGVAPGRRALEEDEQIRCHWVDLSTALDLARARFIRHPGALLGLLYVAAQLAA